MKKATQTLMFAGASMAALVANTNAYALGTIAGTSVNNTATVGYSIGGIAQPTVPSNTASFLVDRKANLTVAQVGGAATFTSYSATSQVTTFTVTNTTNSVQDIQLAAANAVIGSTTALNHTDTYGVTNIRVFVDVNNDGVYEPGTDTATYIDELAPDASKTVFIVADTPATGPAGGVAGINLVGTLAVGGTPGTMGAVLLPTTVYDPTVVGTVFADGAGSVDIARDGKFSAEAEYDIYGVSAAAIKTFRVVSDPINGTTTPQSIPGAILEYCIAVQNTGLQTITNVNVADNIPTNTTYFPGSTYVGGTVLAGVCNIDGTSVADSSAFNSTSNSIATTIPSLAPTVIGTTRFRVTVN